MIGFGYAFYLLLGMLKFMLFSFYTNTEVSFKLVLLNLAGMLLLSSWTLAHPVEETALDLAWSVSAT